jgi:transcriptional regulator with XRE-family HTH domain
MNLPLKIALIRAGKRQIDLARQTGLGESTISRIVNAYRVPTDSEKERIARALSCEVEVLWPDEDFASVDA